MGNFAKRRMGEGEEIAGVDESNFPLVEHTNKTREMGPNNARPSHTRQPNSVRNVIFDQMSNERTARIFYRFKKKITRHAATA